MTSHRPFGSPARFLVATAALAIALLTLVSAAPAWAGARRTGSTTTAATSPSRRRLTRSFHYHRSPALRPDSDPASSTVGSGDASRPRAPDHPQRLLGFRLGRPPLRRILDGQHRRDDAEARRQQLLRLRGAVRRRPRIVRRLGYRGWHLESLLEQSGIDDELHRHPVLHRVRDVVGANGSAVADRGAFRRQRPLRRLPACRDDDRQLRQPQLRRLRRVSLHGCDADAARGSASYLRRDPARLCEGRSAEALGAREPRGHRGGDRSRISRWAGSTTRSSTSRTSRRSLRKARPRTSARASATCRPTPSASTAGSWSTRTGRTQTTRASRSRPRTLQSPRRTAPTP